MRGILGSVGLGAWAALLAGCMTRPLADNPAFIPAVPTVCVENPVYVPLGPPAYGAVFEKVLDIVDDYFEIAYANRYDGRIETHPAIAPGIEQPWKAGSPDLCQRLLAFLQTIRHRAVVVITTADDGGYFVDVKVLKELEDLAAPTRPTAGEATYRLVPTVQRQFEVVAGEVFDSAWIPIGRDPKLEQVILDRLARMDLCR